MDHIDALKQVLSPKYEIERAAEDAQKKEGYTGYLVSADKDVKHIRRDLIELDGKMLKTGSERRRVEVPKHPDGRPIADFGGHLIYVEN